ncbi:MAG: sulfite exporter TauE/SafE family protein [Nitrospiraceae bacterium]|nr:MAG: sulfite exporter TauE/SafE family protein [Nitrospiraceae bacterium]
MSLLLFIAIIFLAAGLIQGISGFGSALIAMPLLTLFIDVKTAVPLCILHSVLMTSYLSFKLKDHMEKRKILPLLAGSLPGIYLGVTFLKNVDSDLIKLLLGSLIASYSLYSLAVQPKPRHMHRAWAYLAGFGTGFIGSAFSAGGPPAIIYTTLTGWSKDHIKATLTGFFLVSAVVTAIVHAASGLTNGLVIHYFLTSSVFAFVGVMTGSIFYRRISRDIYVRIILIILCLLGVMMIFTALR